MSAGKIFEFVDEAGFTQLDKAYEKLGLIKQAMADGIVTAKMYTDSISGANSLSDFNAKNNAAVSGIEKVQAANQAVLVAQKDIAAQTDALVIKTRDNLLAAEAKKQQAAEITLNKYLQLNSRQQAAMDSQIQKEVQAAEVKSQKLIAIAEAKAARIAAIESRQSASQQGRGGAWETGSSATVANNGVAFTAEGAAAKAASDQAILLAQSEVTVSEAVELADVSLTKFDGTLTGNIELLIAQRNELGVINAQIKANSGDTIALTEQQFALNTAISQNVAVIKLQTKENLAVETSQANEIAQLSQLKIEWNNLTKEEQLNTVAGQELNIKMQQLIISTKEANEAQGKFNDNVGNYPGKANDAATAVEKTGKSMDITGRFANILTSRIFRLAASFVLITVVLGAITWLYEYIKALDIFTGRLNQAKQNLAALNEIMADYNKESSKAIVTSKILYETAIDETLAWKDRIAAAKELKKEYPDALKNASDMSIANGDERKSFDDLTSSILENAKAAASLKKLQDNAAKEQDLQFQIDKNNSIKAQKEQQYTDQRNRDRKNPLEDQSRMDAVMRNRFRQQKETTDQDNLKSQQDLDILKKQDEWVVKFAGGKDKIAKAIELADKKKAPKGPKDPTINDDIANDKARLELVKATAKGILDSEKSSYEQRINALKSFTNASNTIINLELKDKDKKSKTAKERDTNSINADIQRLGVKSFDKSETLKIQKEATAEFKKVFSDLQADTLNDIRESLNQQIIAIKTNEADKAEALLQGFQKGIIGEQEYNRALKILRDQANVDKIAAEVETDKQVLAVQQAILLGESITGLPLGGASNKGIQSDKNKLANDKNSLTDAKTTLASDTGKGDNKTKEQELKDIAQGVEYLQQVQDDASKVIQQNYQHEIDLLELKRQFIENNAKAEISAINNSILSSKEKERETAIINAKAVNEQQQITAKQNKIKEQQAKYDKALAIASIIENTYVAIMKTYAESGFLGGLGGAIAVGALGAAQLASVIATPLPAFQDGGIVKKDGYIQTGEVGTELRIDPNGRLSLTEASTNVTYAKAGTEIISNKELINMMGKPDPVYVSTNTADNKRIEKLLAENNELQRQAQRMKVPRTIIREQSGYDAYAAKYNR
jgi:hypothetical protein